ncbi:uncharacterized protein LOC110846713 isoform X2 [Folsomia candida]|uniref:uncharacterized protein LOC110846713 isoform X2 n=1 Tax=Folsomia candida TaxID=158441 RepID=UPI00160509EC|nr:uncharacterized protein LOC110846713 isoform X2 [Folsomia candida]
MSPILDKKGKKGKESKEMRRSRTVSSGASEGGSKFNLKLERVSSPGNKTLSAAGAGLKWLFMRKKPSKSLKEFNGSSSTSFVNPIPIVAASVAGSHTPGFVISPTEDEMQEKLSDDARDFQAGSRNPSPRTQQVEHQPQYQRVVTVPRTLPQERISYGYAQNPHLQNFQLHGTAPPYPGKKLIFRPSTYAHPPRHFSHSPPDGMSYHHPPSPRIPPPHYQQIRNDAYPPPPRLLSRPSGQTPQSINHPHHHQPPPPRSQNCPQQPRHFYNNNRGSFPPTNFPSHRPNHFLPQPGSGFVNNNNYHHYLLPNKTLPPQVQYLQPPVPKPRKSLILRQNNDATSYENQGNNFPEQNGPRWIISSSEHHKLGPPHLIANQRHTSNSCVNLTSYGYTNGENEDVVIRKYSSQSRLSSCNSRSDFGSSSSIPWFRWFASRLEKEGQTKGLHSTETSVKSDGSNTHCIRCNKKLPTTSKGLKWMITAPVACSVCALKVCKTCAVWDQSKNSYSCGHCHPPKLLLRSIDKRKNFWFDNISLGVEPGTNFATAERDKVTENVREHLERIVESHVDEGIDAVSLARIFDHPQYDLVFHRFHEELSDALVNLSYSLKLAIENKPMPMNDTTSATSAHTVLTDLLGDIKEVTMELPLMEPMNKTEAAVVMSQNFAKSVQPSYEDLVATAVINKAITNGQKLRRKADSPMSLVDSAVQTDSEMSEGSDLQNSHRRQYKDVRGWVTNLEKTPHQQHPNISDDDLSMGTSSSNWSNEGNIKGNQQVVIEEQVEEITTTYESDSDISRHPPSRNKKGRKTARQRNSELANNTIIQDDTLLGDIDLNHFDSKVSFPEGGVDIIPRSKINADDNDEDAVEESAAGILVSQISEWEQNWLFKRRKQLLRRRNLMAEAVPMLVPNPNDDGIEPYIGDDKISDLSDLSDHVNDNDDNNNSDLDSSADEGEPSEIVEQEIVHNPVVDVALQMPPAAVKVLKPEENETISLNQQTAPLPQSSIITSKRASEAPHRLSNSSISSRDSASVGRSIELDMASRRSSSSSVSKSAAPKPKKIASRPIDSVKLVREPSDINVKVGKTARFECIVTEDSPEFSVAWFFGGHLISSSEGKSWVYSSGKDKHYLYIYDCQEKDAGKYDVSLFDFKGNETKVTYKLIVEGTQKNKPQPPNFTVLDDIIHTDKADSVVSIPFEITGHPEPYLQVFRNDVEISKLSHVLLEDKGAGQWNLDLRKKETDFPVFGEYVAVAKNSQGQTRVTFMIQETDGILNLEKKAIMKQEVVNSTPQRKSPEPTVPRPASLDSEDSSNGETMREQYHTLNRNQTMVREDYEAGLSESYRNTDPATMTVAEKEKLKWMNPVNLPNNPYAPENLAKRIRQRESNFHLPTSGSSGDIAATSSDDEKNPVMERKQNMSQFSRDYYVHGAPSQPSRLKSTTGPNFGSSRSLSLTSNSSREGSKEKESITSLEKHSNSDILGEKATISIVPSRSPVPQKRISQNGNASTTSNGKLATEKSTIEVATKKNFLGPERTPSPQVTTSRTPSPRPRRYNSDLGGSARREGVEPKVIQLPSVKRLAQQFQASDDKVQILEPKPSNGHQQHKAMFQPREQKSYQQVHSLTARSVSRQFREGLKQAQPHTADINIKLKTQVVPIVEKQLNNNNSNNKEAKLSEFQQNYNYDNFTSDDIINDSSREGSIECDTNTGDLCSKKPGSSSNILARAAFWDKRVEEGIIDDSIVIQEFPKMEI